MMKRMDPATRRQVEDNLFHGARAAVEPWGSFPWHHDSTGRCDTWRKHSSQALAIDVFGTLKMAGQDVRDLVMDAVARFLGLPEGGSCDVDLEWTDQTNRIKETRLKTQIDAVARSPRVLIFFECKFTEKDGGACSQTIPLGKGAQEGEVQCNGSYSLQTNPVNGEKARCALTGKGIRYWDVIPNVFHLDPKGDYEKGPFVGPWLQWMRNLTLCWEIAHDEHLEPAVVITYADSPTLAFPAHLRSAEWEKFTAILRPDAVTFSTISYQSLIEHARIAVAAAGSDPRLWVDLRDWVDRKIAAAPRAEDKEG
jgi:hypothetical protein